MTSYGLWTVLLITGPLALGVSTQCPSTTETNFLTCMQQFMEWEQGDNFWQDVCSTVGREDVSCILQHTDTCPTLWSGTVLGNLTQVRSLISDISDVTCEINTNELCDVADNCFRSVFGVRGDLKTFLGLHGFYTWFCGPDYIQKLHGCLETASGSCPKLVKRQRNTVLLRSAHGTDIPFSQIETQAVTSCPCRERTNTGCDTSCLENQVECAVDPVIAMANETITCGRTDQTAGCLTQTCNQPLSDFFVGMFDLLDCGVTVTACPAEVDDAGRRWSISNSGFYTSTACQFGYSGTAVRECAITGTWKALITGCTLAITINEIQTDLTDLENAAVPPAPGDIEHVLKKLNALINPVEDVIEDTDDVEKVIETIETVTNIIEVIANPTVKEKELYMDVVDKLLDPSKDDAWNDFKQQENVAGVSIVLESVDRFIDVIATETCSGLDIGGQTAFVRDNVYVAVGKSVGEVMFPAAGAATGDTGADIDNAEITISGEALTKQGLGSNPCYGGAYYQSIAPRISNRLAVNGSVQSFTGKMEIATAVVSIRFQQAVTDLEPPLLIKFVHIRKGRHSLPQCVFWDFDIGEGAWSTEGCTLLNYTGDVTYCHCDHLTNFAVLMSIGELSAKDAKALSIISAVGCAISIAGLILTIVVHCMVWRLVRSDRAVILMNLCIALLVALIVFLAGINRVESEMACTVIAVCLHYVWLVVFFLMLLEGIEIMICVVHVFVSHFRIKIALPIAWFIPAVIVAVSLGVTKGEGHGNENFCWLDIDSGLIWAFVGPAVTVILINIIVLIVVFRKMYTASFMQSKRSKVKIVTGLRSLCVLLPLMGITWVLGIASVNKHTVFLQYLFCIFNSLQGLFIFLFHCVFNRQIRDALKKRNDRKRSLQTFSSNFKKQLQSYTDSNKEHRLNSLTPTGTSGASEIRRSSDTQQGDRRVSASSRGDVRQGSSVMVDDWERSRRKEYHKNIRKGRSTNS